jgi:translation initiation factor 2 beta subunit (eIF-2beta)/eIF-5
MILSPPVKCQTCGKVMQATLVGKINPVYVLVCDNPVVKHPVYLLGPGMVIGPVREPK